MTARKDTDPPVEFTLPREPEPVEMDEPEKVKHLAIVERWLMRIIRGDGSLQENAIAALQEVRAVRGACQLKLPGMPEAVKPRAKGSRREIGEFCMNMGRAHVLNERDADWFWDKMVGSGWRRGNQPVRDWRATVRNWHDMGLFPSQKEALQARGGKRPRGQKF